MARKHEPLEHLHESGGSKALSKALDGRQTLIWLSFSSLRFGPPTRLPNAQPVCPQGRWVKGHHDGTPSNRPPLGTPLSRFARSGLHRPSVHR